MSISQPVRYGAVRAEFVCGVFFRSRAAANSVLLNTNVNLTVSTEHLNGLDCKKGSGRPLPQPGHIGPRHKVSRCEEVRCMYTRK